MNFYNLMDKKRGLIIILVYSIFAVIISSYLLYQHYSDESSFCDVSAGLSCDIVNRSLYSEIFNIPVSGLAIIAFLFIAIITVIALKDEKKRIKIINIIYYLMLISILFSLYLIYIEAFVLYSFCPLCLSLNVLILVIFLVSLNLRRKK